MDGGHYQLQVMATIRKKERKKRSLNNNENEKKGSHHILQISTLFPSQNKTCTVKEDSRVG